jgi:RNA polymerase sigma-70 factor (ECF subfamily)
VGGSLVALSFADGQVCGRGKVSVSTDDDFERFFLANYDSIVRSVTMITGDRERATDAVQDAFIKAYAKWGALRSYELPAAWIRRIAINRCHDSHRSDRRRARRERPYVASPTSSPAEGVVGMTVALQLLQCLPPQQRAVAVLFYLDDLSIEEIGLILGLNEGTVKFHLNKARNRLREVLTRDGVDT